MVEKLKPINVYSRRNPFKGKALYVSLGSQGERAREKRSEACTPAINQSDAKESNSKILNTLQTRQADTVRRGQAGGKGCSLGETLIANVN